MSLNQGAREGRKGNMATQDGQGQSIKEPWEMNTEAETGSKLAKQCWEEHDSGVLGGRKATQVIRTHTKMKCWKEKALKITENSTVK